MKALTFQRYGKSPGIGFADLPRPTPKADELLVQVHAASVNPIDNMIPTGIFKAVVKFQLPATLGSDLAGVVVEVGSRVTRFKVGDAVFANIFDQGTGSIAEYAVVSESAAAMKPANLDFVQAASIPMVGLTSWQAMKQRMHLQADQKVFIPAGSGGIGTFAIQLAKFMGAQVGTTTSTGNVELVRSLGADEVVDYKKQAFEVVLHGYDAVLGTVRGDSIEKAVGILKAGGAYVPLDPDVPAARLRFLIEDAELRTVVATSAPSATPSCTAKAPTPPPPPCTRTRSPGCTWAWSTSACQAVSPASGSAADTACDTDRGRRAKSAAGTVT